MESVDRKGWGGDWLKVKGERLRTGIARLTRLRDAPGLLFTNPQSPFTFHFPATRIWVLFAQNYANTLATGFSSERHALVVSAIGNGLSVASLFCAIDSRPTDSGPGTKGGFDFLQVDQPLHRLLANHTGNKSFDVFNLPDGKLIKSVDTGAAQGVALDTQHNCYYVTVSDQKKLVEVDRSSLAVNKAIALPGPPDAVTYFPKTSMVYVDHDDGEDLWVVDPSTQKIVATIKIPTAPEYILYDPAFDGIFQNIKSQPVMLVIDGTANTVSATWSTLPQ